MSYHSILQDIPSPSLLDLLNFKGAPPAPKGFPNAATRDDLNNDQHTFSWLIGMQMSGIFVEILLLTYLNLF